MTASRRCGLSPALLFVPTRSNSRVRFRVLTPDQHPIAVTVEAALAAATALAVARHHPARYAIIAATDGRWLDVTVNGHTILTPGDADGGWPVTVRRALARFAPPHCTQGADT
jgi:hypothetical protein